MRNWLVTIAPAVAALLLFSPALPGQEKNPPPADAASPSVESSAPDHHISGVWNAMRGNYDTASFSRGNPPMTPWGQEQFDAAKPSQGPRGVSLSQTNDRVYKCVPAGMPYIYLQLFPVQIIETPKVVIEIFESDHTVRFIHTDGRKHPDHLTPTYNGNSIGHWEGDTLVVDTVGLNGKLWLDRVGHPDSDQMHITERIHRVDEKTLQVDFTFDDPKSYLMPWTATMHFRTEPKWEILEDVCEDNLAFENFEK